jgi:hypothetical protein
MSDTGQEAALRLKPASSDSRRRLLRSPRGKPLADAFLLDRDTIAQNLVYAPEERRRIVEQLKIALSNFYVHLDRKKALYGFDPVRALDLLYGRLDVLSDGEFHESITEIVARIRDRHVSFSGRAPYGVSAFVPFTIESCWIDGSETYVVTLRNMRQRRPRCRARPRHQGRSGQDLACFGSRQPKRP